jgi:dihydrofolate synthase/folylpolyglutamate synthase
MTYEETLAFLYERLPMFSRIGSMAVKPGLDNIEILCNSLGNPQSAFPCIHVAGTNGKGSVSHMLASALMACGYRTGLYTSPHLRDFRERIRIDGEMMPADDIVSFTQRILPDIEALSPSFFEITVAMAFHHFAERKVDVAVIETGLGGRLDSTNIVMPKVSVITNIGWDHMNLLGDTLPAIAAEKAGIIKPGVPVVIGEPEEETLPVFERRAAEMGARLTLAPSLREVLQSEQLGQTLRVTTRDQDGHIDSWELDLTGAYQSRNLLTVLATLDTLREQGWRLEPAAVREGLRRAAALTGLQGRWQMIRQHPRIVLDVAHNEPGIRELLRQLDETPYEQLHIVTGMVRDKDVSAVIGLLPREARYYFTRAGIPRAMPEKELRERAAEAGLPGEDYPDVDAALGAALSAAGPSDLILVCGSVFLVGEVDITRYADA